jgi:hypothetical protein
MEYYRLHTRAEKSAADKQEYKDVAKLALPGKIKCLRIKENVLLKWRTYY